MRPAIFCVSPCLRQMRTDHLQNLIRCDRLTQTHSGRRHPLKHKSRNLRSWRILLELGLKLRRFKAVFERARRLRDDVVHEQAAPRDPAMQLRRDESGLFSHNGKLLPKSGQELFHVLRLRQEGAEQDYRRIVVYHLLVKAYVWVHLNEFGPWAGLLPAGIAFRLNRQNHSMQGSARRFVDDRITSVRHQIAHHQDVR